MVDAPQDAIIVGKDNDFATAEIMLPAMLARIHPDFATLRMNTHLGNYGLCRIESEFLRGVVNAPIFGKLTNSYRMADEAAENGNRSYQIELNLSCLSGEKELIGEAMLHTIMRYLRNLSDLGAGAAMAPVVVTGPNASATEMDGKNGPQIPKLGSGDFADDEDVNTIEVIADMVGRGTQEVIRTVSSPKVKSLLSSLGIILFFVMFSFGALFGVYFYFEKVAKTYNRSGKEYTNQLEKFREK